MKLDEDLYRVPSSSGLERYTVQYGGLQESCTCPDYQVHRGEISCEHLVCVGLLYAVRRRRS